MQQEIAPQGSITGPIANRPGGIEICAIAAEAIDVTKKDAGYMYW